MKPVVRNWLMLIGVVLTVLAVDQFTKNWIVNHIAPGDVLQPIPSLSRFFQLTHSANTGSAFGFLPQAGDIFLVIALIVVSAMFYFYPRLPANAGWTRLAIGLICGGALGNALDRLQYGHVVDFIHYQIPGIISNVSNLADHSILLGVIMILFDSWRLESQPVEAAIPAGIDSETTATELPMGQPAGQTMGQSAGVNSGQSAGQNASHNEETPL